MSPRMEDSLEWWHSATISEMKPARNEPKWKRFERLVAGLHYSLSPAGAVVEWGERIDGREFDVTIRFSQLAYRYLTVIECKDYLVPVGDVDAFVTKSRAANANKSVMVSSVGFQSGAIRVAGENGIDLYVFEESVDRPEFFKVICEAPALSITDVEIISGSSVLHRLRDDQSALHYFAHHVMIRSATGVHTLDATIMAAREIWEIGTDATARKREVPLEAGSVVLVPFVDPFLATAIRFTVQFVSAKGIETGGMDPSLIPQLFRFKNATTGEERSIDAAELWIGFDTKIEKGRFYYNPFLAIVYYCLDLRHEVAEYILIESYQHGVLFQAQFTQNIMYGRHLLELTDDTELRRLRRMLERYRSREQPKVMSSPPGRNERCFCGSGKTYKKCHGK